MLRNLVSANLRSFTLPHIPALSCTVFAISGALVTWSYVDTLFCVFLFKVLSESFQFFFILIYSSEQVFLILLKQLYAFVFALESLYVPSNFLFELAVSLLKNFDVSIVVFEHVVIGVLFPLSLILIDQTHMGDTVGVLQLKFFQQLFSLFLQSISIVS